VTPLAIPHCTSTEDVILGYRIPKGSILLPNTWWFTHDLEVYPEAVEFRPERFLDLTQSEPDPRAWIFGYGRRICPGRFLADNTLFITIGKSPAVLQVENCVDSDGKIIEPEIIFTPGIASQPVPYRANIRPRSAMHEELTKATDMEYPRKVSNGETLESVR
jgi:cytochrome P450